MKPSIRALLAGNLAPIHMLHEHPWRPAQQWTLSDKSDDQEVQLDVLEFVHLHGGSTLVCSTGEYDVTAVIKFRKNFVHHQDQVLAHIGKDSAKVEKHATAAGQAYAQWGMKFGVFCTPLAFRLLRIDAVLLEDGPAHAAFVRACVGELKASLAAKIAQDPPQSRYITESEAPMYVWEFEALMTIWRDWNRGELKEMRWEMAQCLDQLYGPRGWRAWLRRLLPKQDRERAKKPLPLNRLIRTSASSWELVDERLSAEVVWSALECVHEEGGRIVSYGGHDIDVEFALQARAELMERQRRR